MGNGGGVGLVRDDSGGRRLRAFRSLAGNRALLRVLAAYLLFILTEYAVWIAMIVFAYNRGGTAVAGFVAMAQLVPAAIVAPVATSIADRRSPVAQLTAANVVAGWLEAAGLLAGVLISAAGVASVFAVCAGFGLVAVLLVTRLRVAGLAGPGLPDRPVPPEGTASPAQDSPAEAGGIGDGLRLAVRQPRLRLMMALVTADNVVVGALDLPVVILAVTVLHRSSGWAGYLQFAFGAWPTPAPPKGCGCTSTRPTAVSPR
jgi:hypothetical protein